MRVAFETVDEAERIANRRLPHKVQHFVRTGVGRQRTLHRNLDAFAAYALRNRILSDVSDIDTSVDILGTRYSAPLFLAPTGLQGIVWPEGELAMARAATSRGVGLAVSANAAHSLEDVAGAHGTRPRWMQMSLWNDPAVVDSFAERARDAGYTALVLVTGERAPATRHGDLLSVTPHDLIDGIRRLGWGLQFARRRLTLANFLPYTADHTLGGTLRYSQSIIDPTADWIALERLRARWNGHLILKGIEYEDDARRALDSGVDALIVSNTGGRGMDPSMPSLDVLRALRPVVPSSVPLLVDGGVRTGADVAVARCLGADAVLLGRSALWGLAAGGQAGVERIIDIVREGLVSAMRGMGRARLAELGADDVHHYPDAASRMAPMG